MKTEELQERIDRLYALRQELKVSSADAKDLRDAVVAEEEAITTALNDLGLTKVGSSKTTVSLSTQVTPTADPEKWDVIRKWAIDNDYQALLPRSLVATTYRELKEMGVEIPHVVEFEKTKLSVTKNKS